MRKCSDMTLALACWNNAGVPTQVFVHNEYRTAANGARTLHATRFTDANGVPVTVNAVDVKPGACSGAATTVENIVSPYNALGDLVGVPVREVREFDASGTLVSTTYYDTVTNAPVTLPATAIAVTTSLAFTPVVVEMCEAGVTFLRKFVYHPSGTLFNVYDTTADGQTGFVASPAATIGRCTADTLVANPVHWSTPLGAFQFPNFPNIAADFPGSSVVADFFLHAIEFGGNVYGMDGLPFVGTADLPWASAQTGIDAVLAALGLPAGSIVAAEDPATNQPVVLFNPSLAPGSYSFWAGPTGTSQFSNRLPATTPFVGATSPAASAAGCTEGKAWYSVATGALVRVNTLAGADVTATVNPLTLAEGACPAAAVVPADVEFLPLCDVSAAGVVTEFVRRVVTTFDAAGVPTTATADFATDLVTPYTPTGTVGKCNQDCDVAAPVGVVATWG